ncbi:hypothetical protein BJ508DRAFT_313140 [Ascobolus immersus RN42]|uniref:Uncharacterized protein n=1 Tax=Ascobolus immersus RN42 TaxID=1160509 RepID=A0A3N4HMN9_ASCIM|nr:hypothetical protein BJ508DRAFT_313140 [Ascobolus immersus RN42]
MPILVVTRDPDADALFILQPYLLAATHALYILLFQARHAHKETEKMTKRYADGTARHGDILNLGSKTDLVYAISIVGYNPKNPASAPIDIRFTSAKLPALRAFDYQFIKTGWLPYDQIKWETLTDKEIKQLIKDFEPHLVMADSDLQADLDHIMGKGQGQGMGTQRTLALMPLWRHHRQRSDKPSPTHPLSLPSQTQHQFGNNHRLQQRLRSRMPFRFSLHHKHPPGPAQPKALATQIEHGDHLFHRFLLGHLLCPRWCHQSLPTVLEMSVHRRLPPDCQLQLSESLNHRFYRHRRRQAAQQARLFAPGSTFGDLLKVPQHGRQHDMEQLGEREQNHHGPLPTYTGFAFRQSTLQAPPTTPVTSLPSLDTEYQERRPQHYYIRATVGFEAESTGDGGGGCGCGDGKGEGGGGGKGSESYAGGSERGDRQWQCKRATEGRDLNRQQRRYEGKPRRPDRQFCRYGRGDQSNNTAGTREETELVTMPPVRGRRTITPERGTQREVTEDHDGTVRERRPPVYGREFVLRQLN